MNGVSERMIETITEKARALMIESQAPIQFWGEAVNTASYLHQRTPSAALNSKTPYEVLNGYGKPEKDENGKPIDYKALLHHLRRFGCYVYKRIPKEQRIDSKMGARSKPAMMVSYVHNSTTLWRVYDFHHQKVVQWSDAIFDEERNVHMSCSIAPNEKEETEDPFGLPEGEPTQVEYIEEDDTSEISTEACQSSGSDARQSSGSDIESSVHTEHQSENIRQEEQYPEQQPPEQPKPLNTSTTEALKKEGFTKPTEQRASRRMTRSQRAQVLDESPNLATQIIEEDDPVTYEEAMTGSKKQFWKKAMEEEYNSITTNETFTLVNHIRAAELNPVGRKWVYKTKQNRDNSERYKARLVIKGCEQVKGIDFEEMYAPVGKLTTLRYLLSLAAKLDWKIHHLDVVTAFLNPKIDSEVHMELSTGIEWLDPAVPTNACVRLNKALNGLKQAPRLWHEDINSFVLSLDFRQSNADPNLYIRRDVLLLLYVEDILIFHTDDSAGEEVKKALKDKYKMSDLRPATKLLGLEIDRDEDGITLSQQAYIEMILRRFDMHEANCISTPMDSNVRLYEYEEDEGYADTALYQSIIGSLIYAALGTRQDLAHTVTSLSRYSAEPRARHMATGKRALRYLKKTATTRLQYFSSSTTELHGYTDSDWAQDSQDRKSQGGYVFMTNGPISWQSRKQEIVALSTTEAEYVACSEAAREAQWLIQLQKDVTGSQPQGPTTIYCYAFGVTGILPGS